jgi:hypothetical protein
MTETPRKLDPAEAGWTPLRLVAVAPLVGPGAAPPPGLLRAVHGEIDALMERLTPSLALKVTPAGGAAVELNLVFKRRRDFDAKTLWEQVGAQAGAANAPADARGKLLDAVLHAPAFQKLEAAWRGLDFLATRGEAGSGRLTVLHLDVLAVAPGENWLPRFRTHVFDPDYEGTSDVPVTAVLVDQEFDHQQASLEFLFELGELAQALQAPVYGSVGATFFGLKNLAHLPALPDLATRTSGGPYAGWMALQKETVARWIGLTCNRLLTRAPYGEGEAGDVFYRETVDPAHPEWLPWANAVWPLGVSLAGSYGEHGHCAAADGLQGTGGHHNLPVRELVQGMNKTVRVATEVVLPDEKSWDLCRAGLTPLLGIANGDIAYFPFLGNIYRPVLGSITTDQAMTWHLYAGQVTHTLLAARSKLPAGDPVEVCRALERQLFADFSPFVGDAPGTHIKVEAVQLPDGNVAAHVKLTPTFKIQDKPLEFEFQLPLRG